MRVLMLGWEFPPFITGGLGAACHGLTRSLGRLGVEVTFVLPKAIGEEYDTHVKLLTPQSPEAAAGSREPEAVASTFQYEDRSEKPASPDFTPPAELADHAQDRGEAAAFEHVEFKAVPSRLPSPYPGGEAMWTGDPPTGISYLGPRGRQPVPPPEPSPSGEGQPPEAQAKPAESVPASQPPSPEAIYAGDLFGETRRYADLCRDLCRGTEFDAIHAHDWPTFPAAAAVADETGKPLIVHVHSTEFDRSGEYVHQQIYEIERSGMHRADAVIAVSQLTANLLSQRYGVPYDKITVIYNGLENGPQLPGDADTSTVRVEKDDKIVLYLGRVTHQKGPEYFVAAAKRVLEKLDNVKFVVAGSGDRIKQCIELAAREGIGHRVMFTGFLAEEEVDRIFKMADVYVMPSVSEPFGIATLEAISHDVPVIASKQSGVCEVLQHVLKVDFWDTQEMANKIVAVLRHPPLARTLRSHATIELKKLTWDHAAQKTHALYERLAPQPT